MSSVTVIVRRVVARDERLTLNFHSSGLVVSFESAFVSRGLCFSTFLACHWVQL